MNKATRLLVTTGMAIVAGATMGVGAASASPKTPDAPAAVQAAKPGPGWNNDRVVGYYGSPRFCNFFGQRGENRNRWDDYRCIYQRRGPHHGQFALLVSWDHRGNDWNDHRGNDNRGNDDRGNGWNDHKRNRH